MKRGKRYKTCLGIVEKNKLYGLDEAVELVKKTASAKFDETIDIAIKLNVDPKKSDQNIRSTVILPSGTGKTRKVAVIAKGEKVNEAKDAGADIIGSEDLIEEISKGKIVFDVLIATPDMMKDLGKIGKILGPKGLMPNPKSGTVTFDINKAVKEVKSGKVEFRIDSNGIIHNIIGKASFPKENIIDNVRTFYKAVVKTRPVSVRGIFVQNVSLCSTMGPSIKIDTNSFE